MVETVDLYKGRIFLFDSKSHIRKVLKLIATSISAAIMDEYSGVPKRQTFPPFMQVYNLYHEGKKTTVDTSIIIIKISRENHRRASHSYRLSFKDP